MLSRLRSISVTAKIRMASENVPEFHGDIGELFGGDFSQSPSPHVEVGLGQTAQVAGDNLMVFLFREAQLIHHFPR